MWIQLLAPISYDGGTLEKGETYWIQRVSKVAIIEGHQSYKDHLNKSDTVEFQQTGSALMIEFAGDYLIVPESKYLYQEVDSPK